MKKKHKPLPKNFEEFYSKLEQIEILIDELQEVDISDLPTSIKDRMGDRVSQIAFDLGEYGQDIMWDDMVDKIEK